MKTLKQTLLVLALMVGALSLVSFMPAAFAQNAITNDDNLVGGLTNNATDLRQLIKTMVNYALGFLGLIAVIMVIYGGITYVISAGDDDAVGNAKKIIQYALIGIVVIALSFVIVNAVLGIGTGTSA